MLILNFSYYSLISLQFPDFPEDPDQTRPDQTRLDRTRLDLCPIRTLTAFFKVKSVNFVFYKLYTCVHAGVCDSWRLQVFFCVIHETLQECNKWNTVKVDLVSPDQRWKWTQRFGTHTLSGSAASAHSNVRN